MKFKHLFIITMLAGAALVAYFGLADKISTRRATQPAAENNARQAAMPALEQQSISETTDTYSIKIIYPKFSNVSGAEKINQDIQAIIQSEIREFRSFESGGESPVPKAIQDRMKNELSIGYRQGWLSSKFASIIFEESSDFARAAHPNSFSITANYDLKTGARLGLADIFKPGAAYLDILSNYTRATLKENNKIGSDQKWIDDGTAPVAENFASYYLAPENLVIIFAPYQIAAGTAGPQEVKIPLAKIKNKLTPRILELLR